MKLTIPAPMLLAALNLIKPIAKPNTTHVQLGNVYITAEKNNITLLGMDLEKQLTITIPASVTRKGSTTMPCNRLVDSIDGLKGDVMIDTNESHHTTVRAGNAVARITGLPPEEFPQQISIGDGEGIPIPTSKLNSIMGYCLLHASIDPTKALMNSVILLSRNKVLNFQSSDYRHAVICATEISFDEDSEFIVPRESAVSMTKIATEGELEMLFGENCMSVKSEGMEFRTKLLEGGIPEFEGAYPKERPLTITANREELEAIVKRAEKGISEQASYVILDCDGATLTARGAKVVSASEGEFFDMNEDSTKVKPGSAEIEVKINPAYLRDALKCMNGEEVTLEMVDNTRPIVIQEDGIRCSICPMKLN